MKHGSQASSHPEEQATSLPATVAEIGKIHFEGNITPHQWYQRITLESGKPDLPAIVILAEIIYWYRPYQTLTKGGKPLLRKHFDGDMFQCSAAYFQAKFGLTKDQTRKALKRLEDGGYIRREYRDIVQQGILRNCVMFVEPVPLAILAITHPAVATEVALPQAGAPSPVGDPPSPVGDPPSPVGDPPSPVGDPPSPVGDLIKGIEITTEISTETTTTTPNPSSSTERAAEPENARGGSSGGGNEDEKIKDQGTNRSQQQAPNEERTVSREEEVDSDDRQPELTYPAKLTDQEYEDIAAQVHALPAEVAQQMLDVIQARIQGGAPIRTNPASVLRGIVRKYQADPDSFDPSSGFHVADQRRRRAEAEQRLRVAAAEAPRTRSAEIVARAPREPSEGRRRFVDAALKSLRGG